MMDTFSNHVGKRIKHFRKKQQMTIEELSDKICKSKSTVSKYESGQISIDVDTLSDIAKVLNVRVYQLTYDTPPGKI